jgi:hypothetical protein
MGRIRVAPNVNATFPSAPFAIFAFFALKDLAAAVFK